MGSIGGRSALPFLGAYAMASSRSRRWPTRSAWSLQPFGIQVAIVEPGTIATPIWTKPQRAASDFSPEAVELYGERVDKFRRLAARGRSEQRSPADEVAKAVEHALTAKKPQTRYLVGPDAKRRARVQRLPDRLRDRVLTRFLFGSWRR